MPSVLKSQVQVQRVELSVQGRAGSRYDECTKASIRTMHQTLDPGYNNRRCNYNQEISAPTCMYTFIYLYPVITYRDIR